MPRDDAFKDYPISREWRSLLRKCLRADFDEALAHRILGELILGEANSEVKSLIRRIVLNVNCGQAEFDCCSQSEFESLIYRIVEANGPHGTNISDGVLLLNDERESVESAAGKAESYLCDMLDRRMRNIKAIALSMGDSDGQVVFDKFNRLAAGVDFRNHAHALLKHECSVVDKRDRIGADGLDFFDMKTGLMHGN